MPGRKCGQCGQCGEKVIVARELPSNGAMALFTFGDLCNLSEMADPSSLPYPDLPPHTPQPHPVRVSIFVGKA
ncbi:MAG: hypothetical protein WBA93_09575 [Microcoleaceae cyanobacterium]